MPRKRSKRRDPFTREKNRVRGAANKVQALADARSSVELSVLDPLAKWSFGWLPALGVVGRLTPRRLSELNDVPALGSAGLSRDLTWATAAILRQPDLLVQYVQLKVELESALIAGTVADSIAIIERIDALSGPSLFTLSLKIALIQIGDGLEAQKEFLGLLRRQQASELVIFYAYWWSVRAEDGTTPEHFRANIDRLLDRWDAAPDARAHIRYHLLGDLPGPAAEGTLLSAATAGSVVDTYELLIALAAAVMSEKRPAAPLFAKTLKLIGKSIPDDRISKILLLGGDLDQIIKTSVTAVDFRDALLREGDAITTGDPLTPEEFYAASRSLTPPRPANELATRLQQTLKSLAAAGDEGARASMALHKLGWMLGHSGLGRWAVAVAATFAPRARPFDPTFEGPRFVAASDGVVEHFSALSNSITEAYVARIEEIYPETAIAGAARILAVGWPDDESSLVAAPQARALALNQAAMGRDPNAVLEAADKILAHRPTRESIFLRVAALLELSRVESALDSAVAILIEQPLYGVWLPLEDTVRYIYDEEINRLPSKIQTPILFHFCSEQVNPDLGSYVSYTAEDYILTRGVDRPSAIEWANGETPLALAVHFLATVCSSSTLRLFTAFESEKELEEERIAICQILTRLAPERREEFEDEARGIVTSRLVKEAIKQLQASKLSIDADAIRAWAHRNLGEDFQRYQALQASGLAAVNDAYREAVMAILETGTISKSLYEVPKNEASDLFIRVVTRLIDECAFDPEHGLDCYLSLRIRHGTLSGLLRSAPEKERVVTRRVSETGDYRENTFWREGVGANVDKETWEIIENRLAKFSRDFDALVTEITGQYIQIRRDEKPLGLFEVKPTYLIIYSLATDVNAESSFDALIDKAIDVFWVLVEVSLRGIRKFFDGQLRDRFARLFQDLELNIRTEPALAALADAVIRARSDFMLSLDQVRDWFELPTATSALAFSLEELIEVSLEAIKSFHREFSPSVSTSPLPETRFQGALNLFSDIFCVIFENIYTHSGSAKPQISIACEEGERSLKVRVENSMADGRCGPDNLERVRQSYDRIKNGAYLDAVSREGGTGLPKLAKLIGFKAGHGDLQFDLDCDSRRFWLEFTLPARILITDGDDDGPRVAG